VATGTLWVIATPIGNLGDLSPRAVELLGTVERIACEDTRRTAKLCERFGIRTPRISCHSFNEQERLEPLLTILETGRDIALVSDAGTPGVRDPGALLIEHAHTRGIRVSPIPGAHAAATLLSAAGLDADRYVFEGFLPARAGERRRRLRELAGDRRTTVIFESPHRLEEALQDLQAILGDRTLVIGRELTKAHETILRGTAEELLARIEFPVRGELTLAWAGAAMEAVRSGPLAAGDPAFEKQWRASLELESGDRRRARRRLARELGLSRAELQRRLDEHGLA
jgi:16S rRNA (cytidine1402-2'-O)-methyltransferase